MAQRSDWLANFIGEFIGTFLLVLFGTGSVAVSVLFDAHQGLFQIAIIWGIAIAIAIYVTRNLSCAHFNPAVSIAMVVSGRMAKGKLARYLLGQFAGAFVGGLMVYLLFGPSLAVAEQAQSIVRGSAESVRFAKMFGEYYGSIPLFTAILAELFGTFVLVFAIFMLTEGCNIGRPDNNLAPLFIGLTVTILISILAPLTQGGFNPARDFAPRIVAWMVGFGAAAFPDQTGGFFWVYMLAPCVGGVLAGWLFTKVIEPMMNRNNTGCGCGERMGG